MKNNRLIVRLSSITLAFIATASVLEAQIEFPDPPPISPIWRNVARFSGQFPDTNGWVFYGAQYSGFGYPTASHSYTNWPGVVDVGVCMNLYAAPSPGWSGGSILVTNLFDSGGNPYANNITVFAFGGYDWNVLITTTNDVMLYEADLGDAQMTSHHIGGGLYLNYATNWSRLSTTIPALTNHVVKLTIRSPWQGQTFWGGWPSGYFAPNNGGMIGGVTWDAVIPVGPPGPLMAPATGALGISRWTNGVSVVYWSLTNPPVTLRRAVELTDDFGAFDYVAMTNVFGTNVVGTFVYSTNATAFYRLYSN